jgi:hypothetical protein
MTADPDPVRRRTAAAVLRRIDDATLVDLARRADAPPADIARRLHALDREWDVDRAIELEAAATGLLGLALAAFVHPRLRLVPALAAAAVLAFATTRRHPLLPLLRRLGVRSAREIARERYALKALRGDFAGLDEVQPAPAVAVPRRARQAAAP